MIRDKNEFLMIELTVVDYNLNAITNAIVEINGLKVTPEINNNVYTVDLSDYNTNDLSIVIYDVNGESSAKVKYVSGTTDYNVTLYRYMTIGNNEAHYNEEKDVYEISAKYNSVYNNYVLYMGANEVEIKYTIEDIVDTDKQCDGSNIVLENNGVKRK